jgi:hypothetical protein
MTLLPLAWARARRTSRCLSIFLLVSLLRFAPATHAANALPKPRAVNPAGEAATRGAAGDRAARERAAKRACLTGDADGGVALLTDLFIDHNDPTYLFNQGRCFEQNRRYEDAIGRFREYLIKAKDLGADDRAEAERHIAACESYLGVKPAPEAKPEPVMVPLSPPPATEPQPAVQLAVAAEPSAGRAGSALCATGLVVGAVGIAGLLTGLVLNLKANAMSTDLENEYDPGADSTRKSYKTGTWIGYGAGAAFLAGGAVLYSLGWWRGKQATVAFAPAVGPDLAGAVPKGGF